MYVLQFAQNILTEEMGAILLDKPEGSSQSTALMPPLASMTSDKVFHYLYPKKKVDGLNY